MRDLILHIGFPKTATTYMQKRIFQSAQALGRHTVVPDAQALDRTMGDVALNSTADFWQSSAGREFICSLIEKFPDREKVIISDEHWLWGPTCFSPEEKKQRIEEDSPWPAVRHIEQLRDAFEREGFNLKILVTFRRQAEYLASFYAQCANRYRATVSQNHFESMVTDFLKDTSDQGNAFLRYDELYSRISELVGKNNVLFLPFELLGTPEFNDALTEFAGPLDFEDRTERRFKVKGKGDFTWETSNVNFLDIERSGILGWRRILLSLLRNRFFDVIGKLEKNSEKSVTFRLEEEIRDKVFKHYQGSNQRLEALTQWPLEEIRYH